MKRSKKSKPKETLTTCALAEARLDLNDAIVDLARAIHELKTTADSWERYEAELTKCSCDTVLSVLALGQSKLTNARDTVASWMGSMMNETSEDPS